MDDLGVPLFQETSTRRLYKIKDFGKIKSIVASLKPRKMVTNLKTQNNQQTKKAELKALQELQVFKVWYLYNWSKWAQMGKGLQGKRKEHNSSSTSIDPQASRYPCWSRPRAACFPPKTSWPGLWPGQSPHIPWAMALGPHGSWTWPPPKQRFRWWKAPAEGPWPQLWATGVNCSTIWKLKKNIWSSWTWAQSCGCVEDESWNQREKFKQMSRGPASVAGDIPENRNIWEAKISWYMWLSHDLRIFPMEILWPSNTWRQPYR